MNSKRYFFDISVVICLVWLIACAHVSQTPVGEKTIKGAAAGQIQFDFAAGASLPVVSPVEKKILILKNFQIGTGTDRMLIAGVQVEEGGKENIGDMVISSVTLGGRALNLIPGSEVQFSSKWRGKEYFLKLALYYLINPPSGQHNIRVTFAGPVTSGNVGAISLFHAKQAAPMNLATNRQNQQKKIITTFTTRNKGAWVVDMVGCGHKSKLKPGTKSHIRRFNVQEKSGGKSSLVGGTLFVPTAGEVTLQWGQHRRSLNRLAHVAVEIAPQK